MAFATFLLVLASLAEVDPEGIARTSQEGRAVFVMATQGCFGGSGAQIAVEWLDGAATLSGVFTGLGRVEKGTVELSMEEVERLLAALDALYQSDDDEGRCWSTTKVSVRGACERGGCIDRQWHADVDSQDCAVVDQVSDFIGAVRERLTKGGLFRGPRRIIVGGGIEELTWVPPLNETK